MDSPVPTEQISVWWVLGASFITATCTGLGATPFVLIRDISKSWLGVGNSIAAGLMLGASLGLVFEATHLSISGMLVGVLCGIALMLMADWLLPETVEQPTEAISQIRDGGFRKMLLIMLVMTLHSFAEGIGVGVSFGGREGFGNLISAAIALHNIPEGMAIALVMIPRGVSVLKASLWGIFSSLPQPIMAVPAFLFVQSFAPFLPVGLGLAAGAMFLMVFRELIPEAVENIRWTHVAWITAASAGVMLSFQVLMN